MCVIYSYRVQQPTFSRFDRGVNMATGPSVAVVGGGISGLVCAVRLTQLGIQNVTVFDTGKHAAGGRCSSRHVNIDGRLHTFDHSTQYFTVSDKRFCNVVSFLHSQGAVKVWQGRLGHLKDGNFFPMKSLTQAFVGVDGMSSISSCLSSRVNLKRPVWIGKVSWEDVSRKWKVDRCGYFDYLVIAHNGKCADRLMSDAGVPKVHRLLQVRFTPRLDIKDKRMQLSSLWMLMAAFPKSLCLSYEGAHVEDPDISWVANNTAKLSQNKMSVNGIECWTVFSTKEFGSAHKVPQENIPPRKEKQVTDELLTAFARVTGLGSKLPPPRYTKVQLWGAAVPLNTLYTKEECVFDGQHNVGICGDWLVSPCIQGAAVSGLRLAEFIQNHSSGTDRTGTNLQPEFTAVDGPVIGSFPTDSSIIFKPKAT
ncbi:renalase-like [Ylistrum balloti]|uniref:renalase-like n=1 Tax=Ylistrum balloti TaxID=509963 RepID=UPI002905CFA4|nr:renalase-like [Ylistrum balloti]